MQYFDRLVHDLNNRRDRRSSVSVLLLAYTVAPEAVFPTQLQEASNALLYLLNDCNRSPQDIMITGDSAGGNLALALLSHILHPHPEVPKVSLSAPLRGVFLYSPWVSFSTKHPSYTHNATKDLLDASTLIKWTSMFLGTITSDDEAPVADVANNDTHAEPLLAEPSWWQMLPEVTDEMLIFAGGDEIFVDGIRELGDVLQKSWKEGGGEEQRVKMLVGRREAHIGPIMDVMIGIKEKSESQIAIEGWLMSRLV
ncbi:alpha/beta-hydrolase [Byssothecium circinans]|uniref:Alpha/beta-hydrolase n=1 Tax=Byssothecium circinans TaxID=147558 RepID=A0A6A5TNH0_9PLEO|nr:alpha/beta-hydrolase [Byssothecium circinans]